METRQYYRFWHKPTKKMLKCYGFNSQYVFAETLDGIGTRYNPAKIEDCVLMQCTGLQDIKGKYIYEGDVVKIWRMAGNIHKNMLVKWRDSQCSFRLYDLAAMGATPKKLCYIDKRSMGAVETMEIIGNAYENDLIFREDE